jgi:hypothetical protein
MTKIPKEQLDALVREQLPGHKVVERLPKSDDSGTRPPVEAAGADVEALQQKYGREDTPVVPDDADVRPHGGGHTGEPSADADAETYEDEIVILEPDEAGDPRARGPGPKAAIFSGSKKRIVGLQG